MRNALSITRPEENDGTEEALRSLVTELARDIQDINQILDRHGIDRTDYDALSQTHQFKSMMAEAVKEWSKASNTGERVKIKSAALIEEALPLMFKELKDKTHPLSSRADLFGRIARIGSLGNPVAAPPNGGEAFSITINLGTAQKPIVIHQDLPLRVTKEEPNAEPIDAWEDL
jgi:hypothetical protein